MRMSWGITHCVCVWVHVSVLGCDAAGGVVRKSLFEEEEALCASDLLRRGCLCVLVNVSVGLGDRDDTKTMQSDLVIQL